MDYSRFYTPQGIAEFLIKQINIRNPEYAIDICCGSCNLLRAAQNRWKTIKLKGVDIINHAESDVDFTRLDGREYALKNRGLYSLVLANPPFSPIEQTDHYPDLYSDYPKGYKISRLENEMLLANLQLLSPNGILMAIMPSTFIESEKNAAFRKYVSKKYHIHKIFRLPIDTFGASHIKSCAVYFSTRTENKCGCNMHDLQINAENKYVIENKTYIPIDSIRKGDWISNTHPRLIELKIQRGTISSQFFVVDGIPVLHTAKLQSKWNPSIRYISSLPKSVVYAEDGDIIVSRIGKSAGQWAVHRGDRCAISDCLYRISDPSGTIKKRLSHYVYTSIIKGVATRYITTADFYAWYCNLPENVAI